MLIADTIAVNATTASFKLSMNFFSLEIFIFEFIFDRIAKRIPITVCAAILRIVKVIEIIQNASLSILDCKSTLN